MFDNFTKGYAAANTKDSPNKKNRNVNMSNTSNNFFE